MADTHVFHHHRHVDDMSAIAVILLALITASILYASFIAATAILRIADKNQRIEENNVQLELQNTPIIPQGHREPQSPSY